jgi:hypothetical protein
MYLMKRFSCIIIFFMALSLFDFSVDLEEKKSFHTYDATLTKKINPK